MARASTQRGFACVALCAALGPWCAPCEAFFNNDRWRLTATDFLTGPSGTPVTITWGIADDGTTIPNVRPGVDRASNLVASLDGFFGDGGGGADLTARPWFPFFESSFDRWAELSGVNFVYEPADDGAQHGTSTGILNVRADLRLAGALIDGSGPGGLGTVAYAIAPENGDIVLDTADASYFGDQADNAFSLRHTLMHEIGHSLGLGHVTSPNSDVLMEPFLQTGFDGPQQDDLRGAHFLYGDFHEKAHGGAGNNSLATATPLGPLGRGQTLTVGADGDSGQTVAFDQTDFVSIHVASDEDYFAFSLDAPGSLEVALTPVGATYVQRIGRGPFDTIDAATFGDLSLALFDASTDTLLLESNTHPEGVAEVLRAAELGAGSYAIRVAGDTPETQLYQLDLALTPPPALVGDFNADGRVDAVDYAVWRDTLGSESELAADANGNGAVDELDYAIWASAYGESIGPAAVPEAASAALVTAISFCVASREATFRQSRCANR